MKKSVLEKFDSTFTGFYKKPDGTVMHKSSRKISIDKRISLFQTMVKEGLVPDSFKYKLVV